MAESVGAPLLRGVRCFWGGFGAPAPGPRLRRPARPVPLRHLFHEFGGALIAGVGLVPVGEFLRAAQELLVVNEAAHREPQ